MQALGLLLLLDLTAQAAAPDAGPSAALQESVRKAYCATKLEVGCLIAAPTDRARLSRHGRAMLQASGPRVWSVVQDSARAMGLSAQDLARADISLWLVQLDADREDEMIVEIYARLGDGSGRHHGRQGAGLFVLQGTGETLRAAPLEVRKVSSPMDLDGEPIPSWTVLDVADVDRDGASELVLRRDEHETHVIEVYSLERSGWTRLFSGLGFGS